MTFSTAPWSASNPASARSCTCSLKPPVLPSPSTGGAPNTTTIASWTFWNLRGGAPGHDALLERIENDEHPSHVRDVRGGQHGVAGHGDRVLNSWRVPDHRVDPLRHLLAALEAGSVGELEVDDEVALVLLRDEPHRHPVEAEPGERHER